jgi:hypothetical protein
VSDTSVKQVSSDTVRSAESLVGEPEVSVLQQRPAGAVVGDGVDCLSGFGEDECVRDVVVGLPLTVYNSSRKRRQKPNVRSSDVSTVTANDHLDISQSANVSGAHLDTCNDDSRITNNHVDISTHSQANLSPNSANDVHFDVCDRTQVDANVQAEISLTRNSNLGPRKRKRVRFAIPKTDENSANDQTDFSPSDPFHSNQTANIHFDICSETANNQTDISLAAYEIPNPDSNCANNHLDICDTLVDDVLRSSDDGLVAPNESTDY